MSTARSGSATVLVFLGQAGAAGFAFLLGVWSDFPWLMTAAVGLAGLGTLVPRLLPERCAQASRLCAWFVMLLTLLIVACGGFIRGERFTPASYCEYAYALATGGLVLSMLATGLRQTALGGKRLWLGLSYAWAWVVVLLSLGAGFLKNDPLGFALGLFAFASLLILLHARVRLPPVIHQVVTTLILLAVALPVLECIMHPPGVRQVDPASLRGYYSYSNARKDRARFTAWWNYYDRQVRELNANVVIVDPSGPLRLRLRRNAKTTLVDCPVSVNSLGFRGKEISIQKGDLYRIVVLGESTTFGYGINSDDRPWPELLERLIRERLPASRPVEVINAGIPGATLLDNLSRFSAEILPLQPDMLICYHGINGFYLLDNGAPSLIGPAPPAYRPRPFQLLADAEYGLRLKLYLREQARGASRNVMSAGNVMESRYCDAYRRLIELARTNNIRLVLATFPLAVNAHSSPEVVEFLRARNPRVADAILANEEFAFMLRKLVRQNPGIGFVDAQAGIDGHDGLYLDLMHLTGEGDRLLARNFFDGLREMLETELQKKPGGD
jgi:lysophospholipase L1-like esterase